MRATLALCFVFGCISTNRATLDETAALFHDDLRWGRLPAAEASVDARLRAAFQQHHRPWGAAVRVVDLDVDAVRAAATTGALRVRVTWTAGGDSTDVRESLVEEQWESTDGNWRLRAEAVVAGDPGLFATAATTTPATPAVAAPAPTTTPPTTAAPKRAR
jgi:hypothetical protein